MSANTEAGPATSQGAQTPQGAQPSVDVACTAGRVSPGAEAERPCIMVTVSPSGADLTAAHAPLNHAETIAQSMIWPLVVLVIAVLYRRSIGALITTLLGRVRSISVAGVTLELSTEAGPSVFANSGAVDIRAAGTEHSVTDSTLAGFYQQLKDPGEVAFAVVDLGYGHAWLSSRLYILSVILARMKGLRALVFVEQQNDQPSRFVGVCPADAIRWRLARSFPRYEAALAAGETRVWYGTNPPVSNVFTGASIVNDRGAFDQAERAAELLRGFLAAVQSPVRPATSPPQEAWEQLTIGPPTTAPPVTFFEQAVWLTTPLIEQLLDGLLDPVSIALETLQLADATTKTRLVLDHRRPWLAVVRNGGRFHGLLDRSRVLESFAASTSS